MEDLPHSLVVDNHSTMLSFIWCCCTAKFSFSFFFCDKTLISIALWGWKFSDRVVPIATLKVYVFNRLHHNHLNRIVLFMKTSFGDGRPAWESRNGIPCDFIFSIRLVSCRLYSSVLLALISPIFKPTGRTNVFKATGFYWKKWKTRHLKDFIFKHIYGILNDDYIGNPYTALSY